jgi:osmoprotectant transport system substrate-binding protein
MQRTRTNRLRTGVAAAVVAIAALGISACGSSSKTTSSGSSSSTPSTSSTSTTAATTLPGKGKPTFVMGDKNFPEEYILGDLYQQALEAQGYTVKLKANIGSTEETFNAVKSGQIEGYPEYDGTLLASEANDSKNYPTAAAADAATKAYATKHGYVFTNITPFSDSDAIAVTSAYAKSNHLTSIGDLRKLGKKVILAGAPEFATRFPDGLIGLHKEYDVYPTFKPSSIGSFYTLLDSGKANAIVGFTTDPPLKGNKYVVLKDTKAIFGWQNIGMIAKASAVTAEGPAFTATINKVSALLTQPAIIALNNAVETDQQNPATVAKAFLKANDLL